VENAAVISAMASYAPTIRYVHHHKATCPDGKRVLHYPWACCTYPTAFPCLLRAHLRLCMPRSPYKAWHALLRAKGTLSSLRSLPKLLVASDFMKYVLIRNQIAKDKIDVLPLFSSYPPQEWTAPKSPNGLLFVGRLVHGKGVLELIRLLAKLKPEIHLEIAGDGAMITRARLLTRQYGVQDRVKFSGWLSGNSLMEAYRRNAILIVPALSPEPFGLIGIEAGSFCRPAIAFDVGGIREWLIDGVTGQLVKPEHFDELAGAIEKLVDSPEKLREYGTHARELVRNRFSVEKHLNKLIGLFESTSSSTRR
jgi:glycosyltransferase involved in cell wall biosynthesis